MENKKDIIIAIDGPSASGKSSIAKKIAKELNYSYLDTGAMYRAITLYLLENNIDLTNEKLINENLKNININFIDDQIYLNDKNVSKEVRKPEVSQNVSLVSSYSKVREILTNMQRKIGQNKKIIMDGRDIGSNVFPNAELKIFLTASPKVRAIRRQNEFPNLNLAKIEEQIIIRDKKDQNRKINPLIKASDAILYDNSDQDFEQTYQNILELVKQRMNNE